jgi:outer membrane protein assembly factor BamB
VAEEISSELPSIVWSEGVGSGIQGMPVVTDQAIIVASSDRHIQGLSRQDGSRFWRKRLDGPAVSPLVIGNTIYTATEENGRLRALHAEAGLDIWKRDLPPVSYPIFLAGDTLYAAGEGGGLFAFGIQNTELHQDPLWVTWLPRPPSAGPLIVGDWVVYAAFDSLYLLSRTTGLRLRGAGSPEILVGEAASDGESLYFTTEEGSLIAWRLPTLDLKWQVSGFGNFVAGPVLAEDAGYAVTRTGRLVKFDTGDGSAEIIAESGEPVMAPPTIVSSGVLLGTLEGRLMFFSRDGAPVWQMDFDGTIEVPVFVRDGHMFVSLYGRVGGFGRARYRGRLVVLQ